MFIVDLTFGMLFEEMLVKEYKIRINLSEAVEITKLELYVKEEKYKVKYDKS